MVRRRFIHASDGEDNNRFAHPSSRFPARQHYQVKLYTLPASATSAHAWLGREQGGLRHGLMTRGFRQVLLLGGLLRWARFGGRLSITRLLFTLLWIAGLWFALLRVAWLLFLTLTITRQPLTRRLMAIACSCATWPGISSLSVRLAWRAWGFSGKMGRGHKTVYCNYRDLALDQSLDVPEKL